MLGAVVVPPASSGPNDNPGGKRGGRVAPPPLITYSKHEVPDLSPRILTNLHSSCRVDRYTVKFAEIQKKMIASTMKKRGGVGWLGT